MKVWIGDKFWVFPDEYELLINDLIKHVRKEAISYVTGTDKAFRCTNCDWIGAEFDMLSDTRRQGEDEVLCPYVCPNCESWFRLEDYEEVV